MHRFRTKTINISKMRKLEWLEQCVKYWFLYEFLHESDVAIIFVNKEAANLLNLTTILQGFTWNSISIISGYFPLDQPTIWFLRRQHFSPYFNLILLMLFKFLLGSRILLVCLYLNHWNCFMPFNNNERSLQLILHNFLVSYFSISFKSKHHFVMLDLLPA